MASAFPSSSSRPWRYPRRNVALDYAPPVLEIAKTALDLAPVPGLSLIAVLLSAIVDRVENVRKNNETKTALFKKIEQLDAAIMGMISEARSSAVAARTSNLQARLEALASALTGVKNTADGLKGVRGVRGFLQGFFYADHDEAVLSEMTNDMETALATFTFKSQAAVELAVHDVGAAVQNVESVVTSADEQRTLESIPHCSSAGYHCVADTKSTFMQGTRKELFEELNTWCQSGFPEDEPKQLYALTGGAGLGKSAIAHQLCTRMDREWNANLGASFFLMRGSGDHESARSLFPTLAYQLAHSQSRLRPRIVQAVPGYLRGGVDQQVRHSFEQLLLEPLTSSPELHDHPRTFLVIDGLDECKERDRVPELLQCLLELVKQVPWLRVFVASRPEVEVIPTLISDEARNVVYHRSLDDTIHIWDGDIALFLRKTVPQIYGYGNYTRDHPDALDALIRRANGVFVYAATVVKFLELYNDDPAEQFQYLLSPSGTGLSSLDGLYLHILRRAFTAEDMKSGSPRHQRVMNVLSFISLAFDRCSIAMIALLFGMSDDQLLWVVRRLRSVLLIDERGNLLPLHATFCEFLLDHNRCIDDLYYVDKAKGHAMIVSRCLKSMASSFETTTNLLQNLKQNGNTVITEHMRYVYWRWFEHLKHAEFNESLSTQLHDTVRAQLPIMIRLVPLLKLPDQIADNIQRCLKQSHQDSGLSKEVQYFGHLLQEWWQSMNARHESHLDVAIPKLEESWVTVVNLSLAQTNSDADAMSWYQGLLDALVEHIRQSGTEDLWYKKHVQIW